MNKPCWYKVNYEWKCGFFHQWMQAYEEFECGPGHFPAAIIEDAATERCHVVPAENVSFANDSPDENIKALTEKRKRENGPFQGFMDDYTLFSKRPENKSLRFEPRMEMTAHPARMLVQVHLSTIEVFDMKGKYLCQVKLLRGEMHYTQGGLPLEELEAMFKETL